MVRALPEITLLRGRTEPEEAGWAVVDAVLLEVEVCALEEDFVPEEGLLPEEGFELDGLEPVDGLEFVDGVLVFGVAGFSVAGGTFACATGSPPPLERL